jgi:hypothetical protein
MPKCLVIGRRLVMGMSTLDVMKPWQTSLNEAPSKGGKEGTKRERENPSPSQKNFLSRCMLSGNVPIHPTYTHTHNTSDVPHTLSQVGVQNFSPNLTPMPCLLPIGCGVKNMLPYHPLFSLYFPSLALSHIGVHHAHS